MINKKHYLDMKKTLAKRFKITKRKKVMHQIAGKSHFQSKKSSVELKRKKKLTLAAKPLVKKILKKQKEL